MLSELQYKFYTLVINIYSGDNEYSIHDFINCYYIMHTVVEQRSMYNLKYKKILFPR